MKKEMQKWLCGVGTLAVCVMLTGCGHEHTWAEATCTEPKTCSECGETEGEALGHTWVEATCAEPKHCSVCGETEGEALEHTLTEANYQQAATCEVCGQTVGEPLQADFEAWGIELAELDRVYDVKFPCHRDESRDTLAKVTFSNYQTFTSDESHDAKEGYEWKTVEITAVFGDDNAFDFGYNVSHFFDDYYHYESEYYAINEGKFMVNYNGEKYTECQFYHDGSLCETEEKYDWKNTITSTFKVEILVPVGYDGFIYGLYDEVNGDISDMQNANPENYVCFRFQ